MKTKHRIFYKKLSLKCKLETQKKLLKSKTKSKPAPTTQNLPPFLQSRKMSLCTNAPLAAQPSNLPKNFKNTSQSFTLPKTTNSPAKLVPNHLLQNSNWLSIPTITNLLYKKTRFAKTDPKESKKIKNFKKDKKG